MRPVRIGSFTSCSRLWHKATVMNNNHTLLATVLAVPFLIGADAAPGAVGVELSGLRNNKGAVFLCLSAQPKHFPDCKADPAARTMSVPAARATGLAFDGVPEGTYALSVMHDENGNARLDTMMSIPREGFGFSRNPVVRFGPPKFAEVRFVVPAEGTRVPVKIKYFL